MFLNIEQQNPDLIAIHDDTEHVVSYGELCQAVEEFRKKELPRCVVFELCENCAGALVGYIAFESNGQVPLLLSAGLDAGLLRNLEDTYTPAYYWLPDRKADSVEGIPVFKRYGYTLIKTNHEPYPIHEDLSLLLTTSGSTGSPKLVRHKYGNLEANAANVAKVFGWTPDERSICDLPMNYTMGLNVINSHLIVGACALMVSRNMMDYRFWEFIREQKGTNFCGVPYSYEIMRRLGFDRMDLPELRTLAEGGGKLTDKMFKWIAEYCKNSGKRFCATFGTSETSARMAFLDPDKALDKIGSMGKAIPNGELFLIDEMKNDDGSTTGELGYRGPNVTMGYALCRDDLLKNDEFCGEYHTGDIAKRDKDGFYFIVGRKGRFLKLFGLRVSLDETERILKTWQPSADFVCIGDDKRMSIFTTDPELKESIIPYISEKTNLHNSAFRVFVIDSIPRNDYGKVKFSALEEMIK